MHIHTAAPTRGPGIKFGNLLGKLVNRPLLTTPRRALTLFGILAPRAGIRADDLVALSDEDGGPQLLSALVAQAGQRPRIQGPKEDGHAYRIQGGVAIIPVLGDLVHDLGTLDSWCGMTGYDGIRAKLDLAEADPAVRGALLHVDSPGGEVSGCAATADRIREFQLSKPLRTAYADGGYSAACWTGSQGERVYVPRTGGTGSVGVVTLHADMSVAYEESGLKITVLHAGVHKADGHSFAPLPDAVASDITKELQALRQLFAEAVALGRDVDVKAVLDTEARCLSADEALSLGVVDEILNPDDALAQFIQDLDATASGKTIFIPAAPAASNAKGATMATKKAAGPAAKSARIKAKARRKVSEAVEEENEEGGEGGEKCADGSVCESCPHMDKARDEPPCRDCPDNPENGKEGAAASDDEDDDELDEEDEDEEDASASAKGAKSRIQAILTSAEAASSPKLAQKLAFDTNLSPKAAKAALKAAAADSQSGSGDSFATAMAANSGPALGGGGRVDKSPKAGLAASMDRALKNANLS